LKPKNSNNLEKMNKLKLLFISLLVFNFANAQEQTRQDSLTYGNSLKTLSFSGVETAFSVDQNGVITSTIDTVDTWITLSSGTTDPLLSVAFIEPNLGYAVGENGTILKTTDGGTNWIHLNSTTNKRLWSVCFADTNNVFACGEFGTLLKSSDAGATWDTMMVSSPWQILGAMCFTDINTGYVVGGWGTLLKTTDAGLTWQALPGGVSAGFAQPRSIFFTDPATGYVADFGRVLKTTDAGVSWTSVTIVSNWMTSSVFFTDQNTGYVASLNEIFKTVDAGTTWTTLGVGADHDINSIFFTDSLTGYAAGDEGLLLKTFDAGLTWSTIVSGTTNRLQSLSFPNPCTGYVVGDLGTILKTTNVGGCDVIAISNITHTDISCNNFADGTISISANGGIGVLQYSIDGGVNWFSNNGIFVSLAPGDYNIVVKDVNDNTSTYSNNPVTIAEPSAILINEILKTNVSCAEGNDGSVSINANGGVAPYTYSIDNGTTWQLSQSFMDLISGNYYVVINDSNNCQFTYPNNPVILTQPSAILISEVIKTDVSYLGGNDGTISISAGGGIAPLKYSIDNGTTWLVNQNFTGLTAGNYFIVVIDSNNCQCVYLNNPVIITEPPVSVSNLDKADEFTIYPNPATSKILLSTLCASDEYIMSISNLRGQLLMQDVYRNQFKIEIDISALSAGIYIIKLQTDKGIETKKLIVQ
jgi:photosystem II stability/assembly factor-like uncharacterized protein